MKIQRAVITSLFIVIFAWGVSKVSRPINNLDRRRGMGYVFFLKILVLFDMV